uniref:Terpene synthase n=2 Tax=Hordeum vulgare subsp. vulgare TaxID=112509 RepID=A0A8I7B7Z1_HORVV
MAKAGGERQAGYGRVIAQGYTVLDERRHAVDYRLSVWGDYFIRNPALPHTHQNSIEWMTERRDKLVLEARDKLLTLCDPLAELKMIDALQRLGVSYHFKEEIDLKLHKLSSQKFDCENLHGISLQFRLLRQDGCYMSCDVFQSFMQNQEDFEATMQRDARALLALYEATHLGTPDEQFLEDAQRKTTSLLKSRIDRLEKPLADKVKHALETPCFRRMKILEARLYILLYQKDTEECNETLDELAKLNFYLLQRLYREEVREICEWYYEKESPRRLFYARHRPVESYFWALGVYYEPQYAKARKFLAKFIATITPYDDTFDNYGVWEELQPFANVMQRWDMKEVEQLGECYEDYARFMFGTMIEIENALPKDIATRNVNFIKNIINEVCKGYLTEIYWRDNKYIPPLEDHLKVTLVTSFYWATSCTAFVVSEENITEEVLQWMSKFPQIVKDSCIVARLMDDIVAHELETEKNNVATVVTCYMKEYGTTKEVASESLWEVVENAWKDMNKEFLTMTDIPSSLLIRVINLARMMETMYKEIDGYTDSAILKNRTSLLLEQPMTF